MRKWCILLAVMAIPGAALAAPRLVSQPVTETIPVYLEGTVSDARTAVVNRNYDNWTNPPSALTGIFLAGTDEIADDLAMTPVGAGWLDNMGFNAANVSAPSNLTGGTVSIRFYTGGGAFIGGFNAGLPVLAIPAGGSVRLVFGPGALKPFGFFLPQNIYVSLQWAAATFSGAGAMANLGFQTRGPVGIGASADGMIDVTTNTPFNFGGNPVANTGLFIDTDDSAATPTKAGTWGRVKALYR